MMEEPPGNVGMQWSQVAWENLTEECSSGLSPGRFKVHCWEEEEEFPYKDQCMERCRILKTEGKGRCQTER